MDNREFLKDFLIRHQLTGGKLAALMGVTAGGIYHKINGVKETPDSFVKTLKYMDKVKELTGSFNI